MSRDTAPLHLLFHEKGWTPGWATIGIGDGGDEIGMGALLQEIIASDMSNGHLIAAPPCDYPIVAGVSN